MADYTDPGNGADGGSAGTGAVNYMCVVEPSRWSIRGPTGIGVDPERQRRR